MTPSTIHLTTRNARTGGAGRVLLWSEKTELRLRTAIRDLDGEAVLAYCRELPGVLAQGDDEDDALDSLRKVAAAAVDVFRSRGTAIPFAEVAAEEDDEEGPLIVIGE